MLIIKETRVTLKWGNHFNYVINVNVTSNETQQHRVPLDMMC